MTRPLIYDVRGNGPPLVMIQGVGVHATGWNPQLEALVPHYRCLIWDSRGLGQNESAPGPVSVEQYARDALHLMAAEGWQSAHVVGHSMGGMVALQLALNAPTRVKSLSLLCTLASGADVARLTPHMFWLGMKAKVGTARARRIAFLEMLGATNRTDAEAERIGKLFGHDLADQPPVATHQLTALSRCNLTPRLHELKGIPTLVVSAGNDVIVPPALGEAIAAAIPVAHYELLPNEGHAVTVLNPNRVNRLLLDYLDAVNAK